MALPLLFSLLGSGLAGAGAIGLSPLIAGSIGAGLGGWAQTGDLEEGLKTGLTAGALGGLGGALTGGLGGAAGGAAASGAGGAGAGTGATAGMQAASQAAQAGAGLGSTVQAPVAAGAGAAGAGGGGGGLMSMFKNMPSGMSAVAPPAGGAMTGGIGQMAQRGLQQGVMSGAGLGTAAGSMLNMGAPDWDEDEKDGQGGGGGAQPEPAAANRRYRSPGRNYRPGYDAEAQYFTPSIYSSNDIKRLAGGGQVQYTVPGIGVMQMAAGGLADMAGQAGMPVQPAPQQMPQPNEKEIIQLAIRAVRNELPEEDAAIVLAQFVQTYGEDALRQLVSDVQSGKVDGPRGDVEGPVKGPGDGMNDRVPAEMDDGSQDVLLSSDEFIVPADVVSGLGNGSSEAGAQELEGMMDRVRQERTGKKEQPKMVAAGELLPA